VAAAPELENAVDLGRTQDPVAMPSEDNLLVRVMLLERRPELAREETSDGTP
jgi:hypothetical protein